MEEGRGVSTDMKLDAAAAMGMEIEAATAAAAAPSVNGSCVIAVGGGECVEAGGDRAVAGTVRWGWHVCGGGGRHDGEKRRERRQPSNRQPTLATYV